MDTIFLSFFCHVLAAATMGAAIGLERQFHQGTIGLRTNALVAWGAALFVSLPTLIGEHPASAHLVGQVVVGVGFLGGGVIMREGLNVRGMNTAATLWCSASVGALAGAGALVPALVGASGVLTLNVALRPVSEWLDRRLRTAKYVETLYRLRITCRAGQEAVVRTVLFRFFHDHPTMSLQGVATQEGAAPGQTCVLADVYSQQRDDLVIEELMAEVNAEPSVSAVSWEKKSPA